MELTDENKFAFEEYKMLRAEISKKQDNQYKILSLGIGGITILLGLGFQYKIDSLFLIMPFLIIANNYLYLAEKIAIVNAGKYIMRLESKFYLDKTMGWEKNVNEKRRDYKPFDYAAIVVFLNLFATSFIKGIAYIFDSFICNCPDRTGGVLLLFVYFIVPIAFYVFVIHYYVKTNGNEKKD